MLKRNDIEINKIFRNNDEIILLYKNEAIIYDKRQPISVTKTFQDLINEGYVTMVSNNGYYDSNVQLMRISANSYTKEQIVDFDEVFSSANGKRVSAQGVVGEGTNPNVFLHDQSNLWLTGDEWWTLYNNTSLPYWPQNNQFKNLNWRDKDSVTFVFRGSGTPCSNAGGTQNTFAFGVNSPKHITINFGTSTCANLNRAFRSSNGNIDNTRLESVTFVGNGNEPVRVTASMDATFEHCGKLTTITGLDISSAQRINHMFHSCHSMITIPATLSSTGETALNPNINKSTEYMFGDCPNLVNIELVINMTNITTNSNMFTGDTKLETVYLKGINSSKNQDIDLSMTKINNNCVQYIVDNITSVNTSVDGFTYKNIRFPSTANVTNDQAARLYLNGWNCYIGSDLFQPDMTPRTLTYDMNDGSQAETITIYDTTAKITKNPERLGYYFNGWTSGQDWYYLEDTVTLPITLTAQWNVGTIYGEATYNIIEEQGTTKYSITFDDVDLVNAVHNEDTIFDMYNDNGEIALDMFYDSGSEYYYPSGWLRLEDNKLKANISNYSTAQTVNAELYHNSLEIILDGTLMLDEDVTPPNGAKIQITIGMLGG